jgi:hypothetical protein
MKRAFALALGVAVFLAGCSDASAPSQAPSSNDSDLFFATHAQGPASMTALFRGPLGVTDGCVLIGGPGDYSLPVWPDGFTAERNESGQLIVRNADGATVAAEGEVFEMGGGYTAEFFPEDKVEPRTTQLQRVSEWLRYAIPNACVGDEVYGVWVVGETKPATL